MTILFPQVFYFRRTHYPNSIEPARQKYLEAKTRSHFFSCFFWPCFVAIRQRAPRSRSFAKRDSQVRFDPLCHVRVRAPPDAFSRRSRAGALISAVRMRTRGFSEQTQVLFRTSARGREGDALRREQLQLLSRACFVSMTISFHVAAFCFQLVFKKHEHLEINAFLFFFLSKAHTKAARHAWALYLAVARLTERDAASSWPPMGD